ncbi:hypothetical protein M0D69_35680 [Caballeronia sp. SEWSISQ10-4 2]|uniref:hypothetical protein n=1 Tax=Caballeronia sp. SEWSISQ10-4 2 TaxID=2937438 RepID=UPI002656A426|nr:hypothetical protein [Caballeronia sp. SEWSISQ10-4 2]MDN7183265.1 hypothetical protein [Caballeronia sp. SEWSISQ10-4 2]
MSNRLKGFATQLASLVTTTVKGPTTRAFSSSSSGSSGSKPIGLSEVAKRAANHLQQRDSMQDLMEAAHRREGVPMSRTPLTLSPVYRVDGTPTAKKTAPPYSTPKSSMDEATSSITPTHMGPGGASVEQHIAGNPVHKFLSPFTSVFSPKDMPKSMLSGMLKWGAETIKIDPHKVPEMISPAEAQMEIRRKPNAESLKTATTKKGETWHWMNDPMSHDPEQHAELGGRIASIGIDPGQSSFTNSERTRIFNELMGEHLIIGPTRPHAVMSVRPTSKALSEIRHPDSDAKWMMDAINDSSSRRG